MMYAMPEEPWMVRDEEFQRINDPSEKLKFLLNYAVLAPSIYNTQPWLFKITGSEVGLYVDRARSLPVCDPHGRNLIISCGAALFNLRIAIRHFGFEPVVRTFPDLDISDLLAFVRLGEEKEATLEEDRLFAAIRKRRTLRSSFEAKAMTSGILQRLQHAAGIEGAHLYVVRKSPQRRELIEIIREARDLRSQDGAFQQECDRWTGSRRTYYVPGGEKRPELLAGIGTLPDAVARRGIEREQLQTYVDELGGSEAAFVVLSTGGDNLPAWLSAGQALSRVLLTAASYGLKTAFLNHPVGIEPLRERVGALTGERTYPQIVLRVGYGVAGTPTSRQSVMEVMAEL